MSGISLLLPGLLVWSMSILSFEFRSRGTGFWQSDFAFGQFFSQITVAFIAARIGVLPRRIGAFSISALAALIFSRGRGWQYE